MSTFNIPTIATLANNYKTYAQANSSKINPFVPYTDWEFKANAIAALLASAYQDTAVQAQAIFPQYRTGNQIDITLANLGLSPRQPATYAEILVSSSSQVTPVTGYQIVDAAGAIFNYFAAGNNTNQYLFISNTIGQGYLEPVGTILTAVGGSATFTVLASSDGSPSETDNQCIARIINATVTPLAGGRITDYVQFALSANSLPSMLETLTAAIVIPAYASAGQPGGIQSIGVYGLVGTALSEYQLNQGLIYNGTGTFVPYTRACLSSSTVATPNGAINTAIFNQKLVGLYPNIGSNSTYVLPVGIATATPVVKGYSIDIECQLVAGYTLNSVLTINSFDQFGNPITIQMTIGNIIKREVRRVLVNQPFGATGINVGLANESRIITLTEIEQQLDYQLGAGNITGKLASVILQRNSYTVCDKQPTALSPAPVESTWVQNAIQVPAQTYTVAGLANAQNLQFTYDVASYATIGINLIGSYS